VPDDLAADLRVGTIVRVPLHGRRVRGWVVDAAVEHPEAAPDRLRPLLAVVSAGPSAAVVELCRWASWRWAGPVATFLRAASPPNRILPATEPERETAVHPEGLGPAHPWRGDALIVLPPTLPADIPFLVASEGSTIVVDPSPPRAARLAAALRDEGREVVTVGSEHAAAPRTHGWDRARAGACVAIGGRTAVWAPVPDLTTVIVLDEADEALEEERAPTWNARDVAIERARREGATVRLVTPAPTIDAVVALGPPTRPASATHWPRVDVVDQRDEEPGHGMLSAALADALHRVLERGERAVCVLNRTGRARLLACNTCRELARCERCGATVQQRDDGFLCAHCDTERPLVCLHCHGSRFRALRPGIGRVRDDLAALLPRASVSAVDARAEHPVDGVTDDVLIGTEAVLHRLGPDDGVGLVAYLELDQELLAPRARAAEQALWLLVRGARLVGRPSERRGRDVLLLQTRLPDHEVVRAAVESNPMLVVEAERARRTALGYPPFGGVAELSGAAEAVTAAGEALRTQAGIVVLGPVDRPTGGARALVQAASVAVLADALADPAVDAARALGRLRVDVDPRRV
jgi:primosomal protein N' (replication factor Y) (superfamily II helicase)